MKMNAKFLPRVVISCVLVVAFVSGIGIAVAEYSGSPQLSSSNNEIIIGGMVIISISAPEGSYKVCVSDGTIMEQQMGLSDYSTDCKEATVKVGTSGQASFAVKTTSTGTMKVSLYDVLGSGKMNEISVKVKGVGITASQDVEFVDDEAKVEGTNDAGNKVYFYVKKSDGTLVQIEDKIGTGKVWAVVFETTDFKKFGSEDKYTVYVVNLHSGVSPSEIANIDDMNNKNLVDGYTTTTLIVSKPVSATDTPTPTPTSIITPTSTPIQEVTVVSTSVATQSYTVSPMVLATQTPMPIPTVNPIKSSQTPTQTQKSPAPFIGLIVGIVAMAIVGLQRH